MCSFFIFLSSEPEPIFIYFILFFFTGVQLLYNVVLVSAVQ